MHFEAFCFIGYILSNRKQRLWSALVWADYRQSSVVPVSVIKTQQQKKEQ